MILTCPKEWVCKQTRKQFSPPEHYISAGERVISLEYWSRVWVIQEISLPEKATLMCGGVCCDFDLIAPRIESLSQWARGKKQFSALLSMRLGRQKKPLFQLIELFSLCHSTRVIDNIYGMLGLVDDHGLKQGIAELLEVNYEKEPLEAFWDTLFECGAPWEDYGKILKQLGFMLQGNKRWAYSIFEDRLWYINTLGKYITRSRTSMKHAKYGLVVLQTLRAAAAVPRSFGWALSVGDFLRSYQHHNVLWVKPLDRIGGMESQSAAMLGLAVFDQNDGVCDHPGLKGVRWRKLNSPWRCTRHRITSSEYGSEFCAEIPSPINHSLFKLCPGSSIDTCDEQTLFFDMPDIGFRLVIDSETFLHLYLAREPIKFKEIRS